MWSPKLNWEPQAQRFFPSGSGICLQGHIFFCCYSPHESPLKIPTKPEGSEFGRRQILSLFHTRWVFEYWRIDLKLWVWTCKAYSSGEVDSGKCKIPGYPIAKAPIPRSNNVIWLWYHELWAQVLGRIFRSKIRINPTELGIYPILGQTHLEVSSNRGTPNWDFPW